MKGERKGDRERENTDKGEFRIGREGGRERRIEGC